MKRIEIETACGETNVIYVSHDVKEINIDGEKWVNKEDDRLPPREPSVLLNEFFEDILLKMKEKFINEWLVNYKVERTNNDYNLVIDLRSCSLPERIFKL